MPKGEGERKKSFCGRDMTEAAGKSCITIQALWRDTFPLRNASVRVVFCHPLSDHSLRVRQTLNGGLHLGERDAFVDAILMSSNQAYDERNQHHAPHNEPSRREMKVAKRKLQRKEQGKPMVSLTTG